MKKKRSESAVDAVSLAPTFSRPIDEWQAVVKAAIYQPRPVQRRPKPPARKTSPRK